MVFDFASRPPGRHLRVAVLRRRSRPDDSRGLLVQQPQFGIEPTRQLTSRSSAARLGVDRDPRHGDGRLGPAIHRLADHHLRAAAGSGRQGHRIGGGLRGGIRRHDPAPSRPANRAQLAALVATNILGKNTPAIAANETMYGEFWAQDAAAMTHVRRQRRQLPRRCRR